MIENAEGFLEDYIYDIIADLRDAIVNNDESKQNKYKIELNNSICIAEGLGASVKKEDVTIKIPKISIDWDN